MHQVTEKIHKQMINDEPQKYMITSYSFWKLISAC